MSTTPLLSIGMIFKNEERCIERCLKSLEPLRKAIPCELVMADTGAEDASREIAEKYADEVFDFPWISDFAAARNAVMDRCHGKWYLTIDCDEWLDANISELVSFLKGRKICDFAFVIQRNYSSPELDQSEQYSNFRALRLVRMSTGNRYLGKIHESWQYREPAERLLHTVLHHDGYILEDPKARKDKAKRNMTLLRQKLTETPEDLRTLLQCIESGGADANLTYYVQTGVDLVRQKKGLWEGYGPVLLSHAVEFARVREMSELDDWLALAAQIFPHSIFALVDMNFTAFMAAYDEKEWDKAIQYGKGYRQGLNAYRNAPPSSSIEYELIAGSLRTANAVAEHTVLIGLANALLQNGQSKEALDVLGELNGEKLDPSQIHNVTVALSQLHAETVLEIAPALTDFYKQICQKSANEQRWLTRIATFNETAAIAFTKSYQDEEKEHDNYHRPAYTAFACLADQCEAGRGAKIMMTDDPAEMREWLLKVEDWQALPIEALERALAAGIIFPMADKPLNMEVMDGLAAKLTHDANPARQMVLALPENTEFESLQSICWAQALVLAALRSFDWSLGKNSAPASKFACPAKPKEEEKTQKPQDTPEMGLALVRRFAQLESALLPLLYAPALLTEQNAALLPPMHRWGLYCARALDALDAGQPQEYLATLRRGLAACPGQKEMVQFLLDRFLEDARPKANPELLALAEKIRAILAAYSPDSPAVKAIRESDAYKQVAWIIEETPGIPVQ